MGERDLSAGARATAGDSRWRGLMAPAALLALLIVVGLARPAEPPSSPASVSHLLAAASLARDLDLRFEDEDLERYRTLVQTESAGLLLASTDGEEVAAFPGNPLSVLWVAPLAGGLGLRGAQLAHALALAIALGMAAVTLRQRLDTPWRVLLVAFFGSVAVRYWIEPAPEILTFASVVAAISLCFRSETPRFEELPEVFDARSKAGAGPAWRWVIVGFLLGHAVVSHPIYGLFFVAALSVQPGSHGVPWRWGSGSAR